MHEDFILRNCGTVGWLGILVDASGAEMYRTGKHYPTAMEALQRIFAFIEDGR